MAPVTNVPVIPRSSSGASSSSQFEEGMRVLLVDDDNVSLTIAKAYLERCDYHVTTCTRGTKALSMLRENRQAYDILMLDVHMPEMNGLQLLEIISLEMDIPVVMISSDSSRSTIEEGLKYGACDYIVKPFDLKQMQNLWTHVARKRIATEKKRKRDDSDSDRDRDHTDHEDNPKKKQRMKWTIELHQKFTEAVNILGIDRAGPKGILELMDVPELSREHVASHLQKFRDYLKKIAGVRMTNQIPGDVLNVLEAQSLGPDPLTPPQPNLPSVNLQEPGISSQAGVGPSFTTVMQQENAHILTIQGLGSCVAVSQLSAHVPDSGNNQNSATTLAASGQDVNVQSAGGGTNTNTNISDEDEMLQEDFLVRFFNSPSDDGFL